MADVQYPSFVFFDTLKKLGIAHTKAAPILLNSEHRIGGKLPSERGMDGTRLSRDYVNVEPGRNPIWYFADFITSSQSLCDLVCKKKKITSRQLTAHLCDEPTRRMAAALEFWRLDYKLFINIMKKAAKTRNASDGDIATLCMLILAVTGCVGDLDETVRQAERFTTNIAARSFKTELAGSAELTQAPVEVRPRLGLVRVEDGVLDFANTKVLNEGPAGTVIGSMATGPSTITNVGALVSREHARIFRDENGQWFVEGLGSTNGTTLISGNDRSTTVVEAPRKMRTAPAEPVPIEVGDMICLAGTTTFLVLLQK